MCALSSGGPPSQSRDERGVMVEESAYAKRNSALWPERLLLGERRASPPSPARVIGTDLATEWSEDTQQAASAVPRADSTRKAFRGQDHPGEGTTRYHRRRLSGSDRCEGLAFCGHLPWRQTCGTAGSDPDRRVHRPRWLPADPQAD